MSLIFKAECIAAHQRPSAVPFYSGVSISQLLNPPEYVKPAKIRTHLIERGEELDYTARTKERGSNYGIAARMVLEAIQASARPVTIVSLVSETRLNTTTVRVHIKKLREKKIIRVNFEMFGKTRLQVVRLVRSS